MLSKTSILETFQPLARRYKTFRTRIDSSARKEIITQVFWVETLSRIIHCYEMPHWMYVSHLIISESLCFTNISFFNPLATRRPVITYAVTCLLSYFQCAASYRFKPGATLRSAGEAARVSIALVYLQCAFTLVTKLRAISQLRRAWSVAGPVIV